MTTYIIRRALLMIPTFFAVSLVVFCIINIAPGRPGQQAAQDGTEEATGSKREAYRIFKSQFNLDKPILFNTRFLIGKNDVLNALVKSINKGRAYKPSEQMEAIEWIEDCGEYVVPHLLSIARETKDETIRYQAIQKLSENAQRKVIFVYGQKPSDETRAYNRAVNKENRELKKRVYDKDAEDAEREEIVTSWVSWFKGVKAKRYSLSIGQCIWRFFFETRFATYWWKLLHLDFGISHIDKRPVLEKLLGKVKYSLTLAVPSLIIAYIIAVPLGVLSAVKRNSMTDKVMSVVLFMLYSLPSFFVGTMLLVTFSKGSDFQWTQWFPTGGWQSPNFHQLTTIGKMKDVAWHLVLPMTCMTYGSFAALSRYARTGLLEVINADYIRTARAKGVSEKMVILKHAVRNGMIPVITLLGTVLPILIGGSVIIEVIFSIPGMGLMTYDAILNRDYNVIMAVQLISAVLVMAGVLLADILYAVVDPRISHS